MPASLDGLFDLEQTGYCTQIAGYSHALHPQCSDISKYLYRKVFSLFEHYGLNYFAFAGVLLGYVRNKSMPPWLDDMDVMIFEEDFEKFEAHLVPELRRLGFDCSQKIMLKRDKEFAGYQIRGLYASSGKRAENAVVQYDPTSTIEIPRLQVDVFFSQRCGDVVQNINGWGLYHQKKILVKWVSPGQFIEIDGIRMKTFSNIVEDVFHEYGDVLNNVVIQNHTQKVASISSIKYEEFEASYRHLIRCTSDTVPEGISKSKLKLYRPSQEHVVEAANSDSFLSILRNILETSASTVALSGDHIFWAADLKHLLPGLKINAHLESLIAAKRAALLGPWIDSITAVRPQQKELYLTAVEKLSAL